MKKVLLVFVGAFWACFACAQEKVNWTDIELNICDDAGEWAPYIYIDQRSEKIVGLTVDLIKTIFDKHGIEHSITLLPWQRCQNEVETGAHFQMILNASDNPERRKKYFYTYSHYHTHTLFLWSKKQYPEGLSHLAEEELRELMFGSMLGFGNSDLKRIGVPDKNIDDKAKSYPMLIARLHRQHFDTFAIDAEILAGMQARGKFDFMADKNLSWAPFPAKAQTEYHMVISRNFEHGEALVELINKELTALKSSGYIDQLINKYRVSTVPLYR